jgi:hypothetical protein
MEALSAAASVIAVIEPACMAFKRDKANKLLENISRHKATLSFALTSETA